MNRHAIRAIYVFEMSRTFRTVLQSIASPVISTSLYFVVFGSAIGSRMAQIDGVRYAAFIVPGLTMLSLLNESISNASFGIYMPRFSGTIYEVLSAPISYLEILSGYVGAAASKSVMLGVIILTTARLFVPYEILHPAWMAAFLILTSVTFSLFGFRRLREAPARADADRHPPHFSRRELLFGPHAAAALAEDHVVQSGRLFGQRLSLELLWGLRRESRGERGHDAGLSRLLSGDRLVDVQDGLPAEKLNLQLPGAMR